MNKLLTEYAAILARVPKRLVDISDEDAEQKPRSGGWSKKELLGHLIDSVSNNHQRFVRGQLVRRLEFPEYQQNEWVAAQDYATASWPDLVNLWLLFNRHLLHVLRHLPESAQSNEITVGGKAPVTLVKLAEDYLSHMNHHLAQILGE
ncbi:MAG: DinB family protein [Acidobacteria bacterium]|nr:DinB family protein [Acidobacteriota bacterium]